MNKKKILILGAAGMAGHMIARYLSAFEDYNIDTTARNANEVRATYYIDIERNFYTLKQVIENEKYDIVINCIGLLVKESNTDLTKAIFINSFFPHLLETITKNMKTKIIHLSTDCVFDGKKGTAYNEYDTPNEPNSYGRSKALGEIDNKKDLTIRLSIIGTELKPNGTGLLEWVLKQKDKVGGYSQAYWNGITTFELAKAIHKIMQEKPDLSGLYQLAPDFDINKYELLKIINDVFKKDLIVSKNDSLIQNKTLRNNREDEFYYEIPSYKDQIQNLYNFINTDYYKNYESRFL